MKNLSKFDKDLLTLLPLYFLSIMAVGLGYYAMGVAGHLALIVFFIMAVRKHKNK